MGLAHCKRHKLVDASIVVVYFSKAHSSLLSRPISRILSLRVCKHAGKETSLHPCPHPPLSLIRQYWGGQQREEDSDRQRMKGVHVGGGPNLIGGTVSIDMSLLLSRNSILLCLVGNTLYQKVPKVDQVLKAQTSIKMLKAEDKTMITELIELLRWAI